MYYIRQNIKLFNYLETILYLKNIKYYYVIRKIFDTEDDVLYKINEILKDNIIYKLNKLFVITDTYSIYIYLSQNNMEIFNINSINKLFTYLDNKHIDYIKNNNNDLELEPKYIKNILEFCISNI